MQLWSIGLLVVCSTSLLSYQWLLHPLWQQLQQQQRVTSQLQQKIHLNQQQASQLNHCQQQLAELQAQLALIQAKLSHHPTQALFLLTEHITHAGLHIQQLEPLPPQTNPWYRFTPVRLTATGNFTGLNQLLMQLPELPLHINLNDFSVSQDASKQLIITINLHIPHADSEDNQN